MLGAFLPVSGCVDVLGINTERPYVAKPDGAADDDAPGPDTALDDSMPLADSPAEGGPSGDGPAVDDRAEAAPPDASSRDADATVALDGGADAYDGRTPGYFDGAVEAGPSCVLDAATSRLPFAASGYLVGPAQGYAAPASGCGKAVQFGTASAARVQAENFDVGGEGITYHDTTPGNYYGQYRGEDVDVEWHVCTNDPCGDVDYIWPNEWTEYTIDVAQTWAYIITYNYAARYSEQIRMNLDNQNLIATGPVTLKATVFDPTADFNGTSFMSNTPTFTSVCIPAGRHVLRLMFDGPHPNALAIDYVDFGPVNPCSGGGGDGGGASDAMGATQ
jgi:hypothetical protein